MPLHGYGFDGTKLQYVSSAFANDEQAARLAQQRADADADWVRVDLARLPITDSAGRTFVEAPAPMRAAQADHWSRRWTPEPELNAVEGLHQCFADARELFADFASGIAFSLGL